VTRGCAELALRTNTANRRVSRHARDRRERHVARRIRVDLCDGRVELRRPDRFTLHVNIDSTHTVAVRRARSDAQTDAGWNTVAIRRREERDLRSGHYVDSPHRGVRRGGAVGRHDDDDEAVERGVGEIERLQVAPNRRVLQPGAECPAGGNRDRLVARGLLVCAEIDAARDRHGGHACGSERAVIMQAHADEHRITRVDQRAHEGRIDGNRRLLGRAG